MLLRFPGERGNSGQPVSVVFNYFKSYDRFIYFVQGLAGLKGEVGPPGLLGPMGDKGQQASTFDRYTYCKISTMYNVHHTTNVCECLLLRNRLLNDCNHLARWWI